MPSDGRERPGLTEGGGREGGEGDGGGEGLLQNT